jgi:two-component system nitrate/nitrite response regulator NarL
MSPDTPQTLLVIDDHPLFRKAVLQLVDMAEDFTVVGEASSGPRVWNWPRSCSRT